MSLPGARRSTCRGCNAAILFVRTVNGKALPVDFEPDPAGNVAVYRDANGIFVGRTLSKDDPTPSTFERSMMPHMATCSALRKSPPRPTGELPANVIPISRAREVVKP